MKFICAILIHCVLFSAGVHCLCNTCSVATNTACVSSNQFVFCEDGTIAGPVFNCSSGSICSSNSNQICASVDTGTPECDECEKCDPTNTFACMGVRNYALCLGTDTPSIYTGTCAPQYVCSITTQYICADDETGIAPSCPLIEELTSTTTMAPTTTTESTTPSPRTSPDAYCKVRQQQGRFSVGLDLQTTCKQYIYCFSNGGIWHGALYYCPGSTYFNAAAGLCTREPPSNCV